jgi:hypothetical protein
VNACNLWNSPTFVRKAVFGALWPFLLNTCSDVPLLSML